MKSDLTCPVEIVSVEVERRLPEQEGAENEQIICRIEFFNLSQKAIDSLQMNIICFDENGERLGGRLVRAGAPSEPREKFSGTFMPEHVSGAVRVNASVEKVWYQDGMLWRREERNVREYTPNTLPEGRELDRLKAVAGPDAAGYAREDDIVWMCVCGRANPTSEEGCVRCGRQRADVLRDYSFAAIDATQGSKERKLEQQTRDTLARSSAETARMMKADQKKSRRRRRRMTAVVATLALVALALAAWRWGVPYGACMLAQMRMDEGQAVEAKAIYEWVEAKWPGMFGAGDKAIETEIAIIERLIEADEADTLEEAAQRALTLESEQGDVLWERAMLAQAEVKIAAGDWAGARDLLASMTQSEAAAVRLGEVVYELAVQAQDRVDYPAAIELYASLGDYGDAAERVEDCTYLYGRQLMREGQYEQACAQFMLVIGREDALSLIRSCRYAWAQQLQEEQIYTQAADLYESLGIYEEAETRGRLCRYTAGMDALGEGDLETAAQQLRLAGDYEDAAQRFADAAYTLGCAALEEEDYPEAIAWLEQLERTDEYAKAYDSAVYGYARELEEKGQREAAAQEYALVGDYEDAVVRRQALEYAVACDEMAVSPEEALARFEALGGYKDAEDKAKACRYMTADAYYAAGEYAKALEGFEALGKYGDSANQALRSRYALALELEKAGSYDEAAVQFEACGAYLGAEDKAMRARYDAADALEKEEKYEEAAWAFDALGSYEDAKLRTRSNEDAWLQSVYTAAKMDMELGDYDSVITALEVYQGRKLPLRYEEMKGMYEDACLSRAKELIGQGRPHEALPALERIPEDKIAQKLLDAYVFRVIGRWKDVSGKEYIFRRDGSCSIGGEEMYYAGKDYDLTLGDEPNPTKAAYNVVSLKKNTLTLRAAGTKENIRLSYVGEAEETAAAQEEASP